MTKVLTPKQQQTCLTILAKIEQYDTIIIHRHVNPDPDAIGSQGGLKALIEAAYPYKKVYAVGSDVHDLSWIGTPETVADEIYQEALVIVVDTANRPRISDQRFTQGRALIKIDHHPNDDVYGDPYYVDETASSCSEIIVDLAEASQGKLPLTKAAAWYLYAGIVGDTGRFMYPSSTDHTLEVAASLWRTGVDYALINQRLAEVTLAQAQLQAAVLNHLKVDKSGAAHVVITQQDMKELQVTPDQVAVAVSTPGRLKGVYAWVMFVEKEDGTYRVHLRSKGPIINDIARAHDGGGHPLASGANAYSLNEMTTMIQELDAVVAAFVADQV